MTTLGTILHTAFNGRLVGKDSFGNRYYEARSQKTATGHKKRWVIYDGVPEASKVPPLWHGWLHYSTDELPQESNARPYSWTLEPQQNMTGTKLAYVPNGHVSRGGLRDKTTADYQPWKP